MIYLMTKSCKSSVYNNLWETILFNTCYADECILEGISIKDINQYDNINNIAYMLHDNYLTFVPNTGDNFSKLNTFFEGEYILIYEFLGRLKTVGASVAKHINKDKVKKVIGAVGKGIHKGREKLNSVPGAGKLNSTGAGILTYKAGEAAKAGVKHAYKHPVTSALNVAAHAVAHPKYAMFTMHVHPEKHKQIAKTINTATKALDTPVGAKVAKIAGKEGLKYSIKHPIKATKAAHKIAKPWLGNMAKDLKHFVKNHPVETAAHVASQAVIPGGPMSTQRALGMMAVHNTGDYIRSNKGHLAKSAKKDSKRAAVRIRKAGRYLTRQQPVKSLPTAMITTMPGAKAIRKSYKDFDHKHGVSKNVHTQLMKKAAKRVEKLKAQKQGSKHMVHQVA